MPVFDRYDLNEPSQAIQALSFEQWVIIFIFDLSDDSLDKTFYIKTSSLLRLENYDVLAEPT